MNSFYSEKELSELGLEHYGKDVLISRNAKLYGSERIIIGNHVRIDDFCVLSGHIVLGNHIHVAAYSALFGGTAGIVMQDFSTVSSRCAIYALSDDYSGESMTNPTISEDYKNIVNGMVEIGRHVIIGSGTTVLPMVTIGEGAAVGCMSLVNRSLEPWGIYAGIPCKRMKDRKKDLLRMEERLSMEAENRDGK